MRCNVTGITEGPLYEFRINNDFGFKAIVPLESENFSFVLCESEFMRLMEKGIDCIEEKERDDYIHRYNKWFSSEQIYDLISTFLFVPNGYYRNGQHSFTDEEEQLFWDHMEQEKVELLKAERIKELIYFIHL